AKWASFGAIGFADMGILVKLAQANYPRSAGAILKKLQAVEIELGLRDPPKRGRPPKAAAEELPEFIPDPGNDYAYERSRTGSFTDLRDLNKSNPTINDVYQFLHRNAR